MILVNTTKISVIIPTYNRSSYIVNTIESFLCQDYPDFEIIVCNNNSTDDTQDVLENYLSNSKINIIFEKRQGVHFARNTAAKHAKGRILYFTDDDMIATPNLLTEIRKIFEMDSRVASATGQVLPKWEIPPPKWVEKFLFNSFLSLNNPVEDIIISSTDCNVFSCHQAILREVFFMAGGFNPENVAGSWIGDGETGLNIKIKELGYKFGYIYSSVIYHSIPASRMTQKYLNTRLRNQGNSDAYTILRKNKGTINFSKEMIEECFYFLKETLRIFLRSRRDVNLLRFIWADLEYRFAKLAYYRRAENNSELMSMILKNNWLD